jgi:hypothetical protein
METHVKITHADSPAVIGAPWEPVSPAQGELFVDTSGGPVILVLPDDPTTTPLLLAAVVYKRRIFKVSNDTNPISLRPLSTHRVNSGAPGADVVLPASNVGGFRSWTYRWALVNTWDAG